MAIKASLMLIAYEQAKLAYARGEVPVGAVVSLNGEIIAAEGNRTVELKDVSAHAEILAIREASLVLGCERLTDCNLHVTLEPCTMCAGAISYARIKRLYYGASDPKSGGIEHGAVFFQQAVCHHAPEVYPGFMERECSKLLKDFFYEKRK